MPGWTSYFVASVFVALAYWSFSYEGVNGTTILFAVLAGMMFFRGANGRDITAADDVAAPLEFVQNPAGAIVDAAVDKVAEIMSTKNDADGKGIVGTAVDKLEEFLSPDGETPAAFDPDAAIERYLANRPEPAPAPAPVTDAAAAPARAQFGRKGL